MLPVTSCWHHISMFIIYGFCHWRHIWWNVKTHQLVIVLTEHKYMLIRHAIFHCELFSWFIFLDECKILNFINIGKHMHTVSWSGWPLACYQSNSSIPPIISIFKLHSTVCPLSRNLWTNLRLHNHCWLVYRMSVFNSKTWNLQTWKYDVIMTSSVSKNIIKEYLTSPPWFLLNIPPKFCKNLNIFHGDIKENMSGCFFLNTV